MTPNLRIDNLYLVGKMLKSISPDSVRFGRTCLANLGVRSCPVRKLKYPVQSSPNLSELQFEFKIVKAPMCQAELRGPYHVPFFEGWFFGWSFDHFSLNYLFFRKTIWVIVLGFCSDIIISLSLLYYRFEATWNHTISSRNKLNKDSVWNIVLTFHCLNKLF